MFTEDQVTRVQKCLSTNAMSKVYIGTDSARSMQSNGDWYASYTTAIVIHKLDEWGIGHGCKVFTQSATERDYDQVKNRPMMRMMNEAYRSVEAYQQLEETLLDYEVEIHLDVNDDPKHGSNCARNAAVGIAMQCGRPVLTKPEAHAASFCADRGVAGKLNYANT